MKDHIKIKEIHVTFVTKDKGRHEWDKIYIIRRNYCDKNYT